MIGIYTCEVMFLIKFDHVLDLRGYFHQNQLISNMAFGITVTSNPGWLSTPDFVPYEAKMQGKILNRKPGYPSVNIFSPSSSKNAVNCTVQLVVLTSLRLKIFFATHMRVEGF